MTSLKKRALTATIWSAVAQFGAQITQFGIILLLSRMVSKDAFGIIALTNVVCTFLMIFAKKGFDDAIIQREDLDHIAKNSAFWTSFFLGSVLTLAGCAISPLAAWFFEEPQMIGVLSTLSLSLLIGSMAAVPQALLRRELRMKPLALRSIGGRITGGAVAVGMAYAGMGVWSLVAMQLVSEFVAMILLWLTCGFRPGGSFSLDIAKQLLNFGIKVIGAQTMNFLNRRYDIFVIAKFYGMETLGVYSIAMKMIDLSVAIFMGVYSQVGYPLMCRLTSDMERFRRNILSVFEWISSAVTPLVLTMVFFSSLWVDLLFGEKWIRVAPILTLLAPMLLVKIPSWAEAIGIIALDEPGARLKIAVGFAVISVISLSIAGNYSVHWFALTSSARYFFIAVPTALVFCHYSGIKTRRILMIHLMPLILGIITIGTSSFLAKNNGQTDTLSLLPFAIGGLILYAGILSIFKRKEIAAVIGHVRNEIVSVSLNNKQMKRGFPKSS